MCRGEIIPKGLYHLSVSVWIVNQQGQYLLSQRHPKKQYPLYWECTGGSVLSGETSLQGAIREVKEELGMDQSRLSVVSRTAMIRGGLEGFSLRSLSAWANAKRLDDILIRGAEERGYLVRDTAAELLNVTPRTAWEYLTRLNREGQLTKVGIRYYPVGSAIPVENQVGVLQTYLTEHGIAGRQALAGQLGITPCQATHILQGMVARGELELVGKRYRLPQKAPEGNI